MPMRIIADDCINCAACEEDCPTDSISQGDDTYVVDAAGCTECKGEHESPHCVEVCPIDGCIVAAA
jgi:ferredoxin